MAFSKGPYYLTNVNNFYLDILKKPDVPKNPDDEYYVIEKQYEFRPDKLAHKLYGDERYWYVLMLRNIDVIEDPIFDFKEGLEIRLPSSDIIRRL